MSLENGSQIAILKKLVEEQKSGRAVGIYSVCSANRFVIRACMEQALVDGSVLLIESTSNQVNQFGGYTGMRPDDFVHYVQEIARNVKFPLHAIIFGGDHLGPHPWQVETAGSAMEKARRLVWDYVKAGYVKIHLDASMPLGGDEKNSQLLKQRAADRAAELCQAAEEAFEPASRTEPPVYVIGSEVPPPGGVQEVGQAPEVTCVQDAKETIEITRAAFYARGLEQAWDRVIALVVQPGVEFGDQAVYEYNPEKAGDLKRFIETIPEVVYEAHSTDYQTKQSLRRMVEDHFAILKVGPGLTFALREAVFALGMIERELLGNRPGVRLSEILETTEHAMLQDPRYWKAYYGEDEIGAALRRKYSLSDRIRYYWPRQAVEQALERLFANLEQNPPPPGLVSQYLPVQYQHFRQGLIANRPLDMVLDKIKDVARDYAWACRMG